MLTDGLAAAEKDEDPSGFGYNGDKYDGLYKMFESFVRTGDRICERAAEAVGDLADEVTIRHGDEGGNPPKMNWVPVPSWDVPCKPH